MSDYVMVRRGERYDAPAVDPAHLRRAAEPLPRWLVVCAALLPLIAAVVTVSWALGKYPDRPEFDTVVERQRQQIEQLQTDMRDLQVDTGSLKTSLEAIKGSAERQERRQENIERKLDEVLRLRWRDRNPGSDGLAPPGRGQP